MISQVILEYTGQIRNRKKVSSHMQHLKKISDRMLHDPDRLTEQIVGAAAELREANTEDIANINLVLRRIQNAIFVLAKRKDEMELAAFDISRRRRRQGRGKIQALPKSQIRPKRILQMALPIHFSMRSLVSLL